VDTSPYIASLFWALGRHLLAEFEQQAQPQLAKHAQNAGDMSSGVCGGGECHALEGGREALLSEVRAALVCACKSLTVCQGEEVYVCVCVYMYTYVCVCVYIHMSVSVYICIHMSVSVYICIHMYICDLRNIEQRTN
jgi:hypothetical protein